MSRDLVGVIVVHTKRLQPLGAQLVRVHASHHRRFFGEHLGVVALAVGESNSVENIAVTPHADQKLVTHGCTMLLSLSTRVMRPYYGGASMAANLSVCLCSTVSIIWNAPCVQCASHLVGERL